MTLTRRALLAATAGGALAACGSPEPPTESRSGSATTVTTPIPSSSTSGVSQSTGSTPSPVPALGATRSQIITRYRGVQPTTWGLDVGGVTTRLPTMETVVALTFDACGGPRGSGYDGALIDVLRSQAVPATLFVNSRWIDANPRVFSELVTDPLFEIANHGTRHLPLSVTGRSAYGIAGTQNVGEVFDEIAGNRHKLDRLLGKPPRFFRSGTAHYDDVATRIVTDLGEQVIGFDVNGDKGATLNSSQVEQALLTARPGSIVIGHMNQPQGGTAGGVAAAIPRLLGSGLRFVRISEYLG